MTYSCVFSFVLDKYHWWCISVLMHHNSHHSCRSHAYIYIMFVYCSSPLFCMVWSQVGWTGNNHCLFIHLLTCMVGVERGWVLGSHISVESKSQHPHSPLHISISCTGLSFVSLFWSGQLILKRISFGMEFDYLTGTSYRCLLFPVSASNRLIAVAGRGVQARGFGPLISQINHSHQISIRVALAVSQH